MIRGETVPLTLDFSGQDVDFALADAGTLLVTLKQGNIEVTKAPTVVDATTLTVELTQTESLGFKMPSEVCPLGVQVNFLAGGVRYPSEVTEITVGKQLYDEVIE